jgi:hypothetical protein
MCALALSLVAGMVLVPRAQASLGACGSDPIVVLSNGVIIDLSALIGVAASDVQQVRYTLHIPSGLSVRSIIYTPSALGHKEVLQLFAGDAANTYDSVTVVNTGTKGIVVRARMSVIAPSHFPASAFAYGMDHQYLPLHVGL